MMSGCGVEKSCCIVGNVSFWNNLVLLGKSCLFCFFIRVWQSVVWWDIYQNEWIEYYFKIMCFQVLNGCYY